MKIEKAIITNFRGFRKPTTICFNELTAFVGRNDVGKSTVLEALDLFFNDGKGVIKYDKSDVNIESMDQFYEITIEFSDLPKEIVLDSSYQTSLVDEFLINESNNLTIKKRYNGSKCTGVFIVANHPTNPNCSELHTKKKKDLVDIISKSGITCENKSINAVMRKAIWNNYSDDLELDMVDIDVNSGEDTKHIWAKLSHALPIYSLFQSDRSNNDGDKEIQDPLKIAVAQFFQDVTIQNTLRDVAASVEKRLREVSERTLEKLREMDPNIADGLNPIIPSSENLKWADVFTKNVSITSDDNIPINKRGSGVKRLILLNFFRAEVERRSEEGDETGVIYAIEEPETSQHFANQRVLADSLIALSKTQNTQVIMTTHSSVIVKRLNSQDIRIVSYDNSGERRIMLAPKSLLGYTSLNEINYIALSEITEEYHDELFGYIESKGMMNMFELNKKKRPYIRQEKNGSIKNEERTLSRYIRDVNHHPENNHNPKYTYEDLALSIYEMRSFIETTMSKNKELV